MARSADIPRVEELLRCTEVILATYDPTALTYLDVEGSWQKNPAGIVDRISCELWFRVWEAQSEEACVGRLAPRVDALFRPLVESDSFKGLVAAFAAGGGTRARCDRAQSGVEPLLAVAAVLYRLIEYKAYSAFGENHVAQWDRQGRRTRELYAGKLENLSRELRETLRGEGEFGQFLSVLRCLESDPTSIFSVASVIVCEEERVRAELDALLSEFKTSHEKEELSALVCAHVCPEPAGALREPRALVRPCIELLLRRDVDVSSGIQYRAAAFLGKAGDVRSTESLLEALRESDPRHSFLRSNLIYALGNMRQERVTRDVVGVLEGPDHLLVASPDGSSAYRQPLDAEKREAIWALGKLGAEAGTAAPSLVKYATSADREARTYLAWAMGEIGAGQKHKSGGVDATIPIALMNLLTSKDNATFEEATFALRKLGLPDFLHTLYLRDFTTVPILALKPSSSGLYELSETILHLVSVKRPVIMAVTGDSGTGKTYFCRTISRGFGGIEASEILYLMRDGPENRVFDRILGLKWLKQHNEPRFYENYPLSEDQDDPDGFFEEFLAQNEDKKLIILDGWRDEPYFHQVVRKFYEKDHLDVLVRFQTTFSTRRINLEEREGTLERVRMHLPLIETPAIEETSFYKEGAVLIYSLDNSIPSRLSAAEILEVFGKVKVDTWGDQIRIGKFARGLKPLVVNSGRLERRSSSFKPETGEFAEAELVAFVAAEESFTRVLNEDLALSPNLLQSIRLRDLQLSRIAFYNHGQLACCGQEGSAAILSGFNDRMFSARVHAAGAVGIAVVGGDICTISENRELRVTSFHRNTSTLVAICDAPPVGIAPFREHSVVTSHSDGTVRVWELQTGKVTTLRGHSAPVFAVTSDRAGRLYSGDLDGELRVWDLDETRVNVFRGHGGAIASIDVYADGRVVTGTGRPVGCAVGALGPARDGVSRVRIVDPEDGTCDVFEVVQAADLCSLNVYFDGRILVGLTLGERQESEGSLVVFDPRPDFLCYSVVRGHSLQTRDIVSMGPRIITCGSETAGQDTLCIWGTTTYVEMERSKLKLMPETMGKPPHYRSLF